MRIVVCGAAGFIGTHLVKRLKKDGHWVRGIDIKQPEFEPSEADEFVQYDLREKHSLDAYFKGIDRVYQLAANMGGAGFVFTGDNDAAIMHDNALINLAVLDACVDQHVPRIFYSSSACVYPADYANMPNLSCREATAYPADPDSAYGWEKLFSERLYAAYAHNYKITAARIARFHNIFGPLGTWRGGREKAPAALCRKIAEVPNGGEIELWGNGQQTRSFCYIDDCIEGTVRLMESAYAMPLNIGSAEMVSMDHLATVIALIADKVIQIKHVPGPVGVQGRNSNNDKILKVLNWAPRTALHVGLVPTYAWVAQQVQKNAGNGA